MGWHWIGYESDKHRNSFIVLDSSFQPAARRWPLTTCWSMASPLVSAALGSTTTVCRGLEQRANYSIGS
jgi:hypothetical protein